MSISERQLQQPERPQDTEVLRTLEQRLNVDPSAKYKSIEVERILPDYGPYLSGKIKEKKPFLHGIGDSAGITTKLTPARLIDLDLRASSEKPQTSEDEIVYEKLIIERIRQLHKDGKLPEGWNVRKKGGYSLLVHNEFLHIEEDLMQWYRNNGGKDRLTHYSPESFVDSFFRYMEIVDYNRTRNRVIFNRALMGLSQIDEDMNGNYSQSSADGIPSKRLLKPILQAALDTPYTIDSQANEELILLPSVFDAEKVYRDLGFNDKEIESFKQNLVPWIKFSEFGLCFASKKYRTHPKEGDGQDENGIPRGHDYLSYLLYVADTYGMTLQSLMERKAKHEGFHGLEKIINTILKLPEPNPISEGIVIAWAQDEHLMKQPDYSADLFLQYPFTIEEIAGQKEDAEYRRAAIFNWGGRAVDSIQLSVGAAAYNIPNTDGLEHSEFDMCKIIQLFLLSSVAVSQRPDFSSMDINTRLRHTFEGTRHMPILGLYTYRTPPNASLSTIFKKEPDFRSSFLGVQSRRTYY